MSVGSWLEGYWPVPQKLQVLKDWQKNIKLQDQVAQKMKELRYEHGAWILKRLKQFPVFDGDNLSEMRVEKKNRAKDLIEDFMISSMVLRARFLTGKNFPSIRESRPASQAVG